MKKKGNGSLNVEGKESTSDNEGVSYAICAGENITINSGTIHAKSGRANNNNVGISTMMGTITINGGYVESDCVYVNDGSTAYFASSIVLNGCSITSPAGGYIGDYDDYKTIFDKNNVSARHVII